MGALPTAASIASLLVAVYVPAIADILGVTGPGLRAWLLIGAGSAVTLTAGRIWLSFQGRMSPGGD